MSTGIEIKVWLNDQDEPVERAFARIVQPITTWTQTTTSWNSFSVKRSRHDQPLITVLEPMSANDLLEQVTRKDWKQIATAKRKNPLPESPLDPLCLSVTTSFHCKQGISDILMPISISCWNRSFLKGRDWHAEGDASIYLEKLSPYIAPLLSTQQEEEEQIFHPDRHANRQERFLAIEENLDQLLDLLTRLVEQVQPKTIKVFDEALDYVLLNTRLVYYRNEASIIDDLQFLMQMWENSGDTYMPKRRQGREQPEDREIWQQFQRLLSQKLSFSEEKIRQALHTEDLYIYSLPVGWMILSYPYYFNAFLDHFYLKLITSATV